MCVRGGVSGAGLEGGSGWDSSATSVCGLMVLSIHLRAKLKVWEQFAQLISCLRVCV